MKTRCINLKDFEVRGLLDGSITALWRPVKDQSMGIIVTSRGFKPLVLANRNNQVAEIHCPYGQQGDVLIGREAWELSYGKIPLYKAGSAPEDIGAKWKSPATMPAKLARIRREIVSLECIQGKGRPIEGSISEWETEREQWFWKIQLKEAE